MMTSHARWPRARRTTSVIITAILATSTLATAVPRAHAQLASPAARAFARPATRPPTVQPGQASAMAVATRRPVLATALTTPDSVTVANPNGTYTVRESLQPVRAWHDGRWASLDPALQRNPDGTISPAVTTNRLTLSGGGTQPLAVMNIRGWCLSLSWPGRLPRPSLSGATATYPQVLPGVDLAVTATAQGGFSDVLVIKNAAAAADPRLARLSLTTARTGLQVTVSKTTGLLGAAVGPHGAPLVTALAPRMWDSAAPPARMVTRPRPAGQAMVTGSGLPAYSTAAAPGAAAHATTVPVTVSRRTITLAPPATALTGRHIIYPVYIDPTWTPVTVRASNWTQVDSGFKTQSYWMESSDLQVGLCPSSYYPPGACNDPNSGVYMGVARAFFTLPMPSQLVSNTVVNSADLYMTNDWAPVCTPTTEAQLWHVGTISRSTSWQDQPSWSDQLQQQSFAYGNQTSCGYQRNNVTWSGSALTSLIQSAATNDYPNETFGIRATDESNQQAWKKFWSGSGNIEMTITYADPPNQPTRLSTNPGGSCQTSTSNPAQIGNDDVTFNAYVSDNTPDTPLTTRYVITNATGTVVYDSDTKGTSVKTGRSTTAALTLTRAIMQGLQTGGTTTAYTYHWYAISTNDDTLTGPRSDTCYFTYNPNNPGEPTIQAPGSGTLGQQITATFSDSQPSPCGSSSDPCPASYTYQLGTSAPVTITASPNGQPTNATITITHLDDMLLTVYGTAANGNLSEAATTTITGLQPSPIYPDGYFTGPGYPDLLTPGTGSTPSLWLSPGTADGTAGPPIDIGSLGTGLGYNNAKGPAQWANTMILHGNFTGDGVQDVMAYYPQQGDGAFIGGTGDPSTLVSAGNNVSVVTPTDLSNGTEYPALTDPVDLAGAGNASQIGTSADDLIGIAPNSNGYELDLYTNGTCPGCAVSGGYAFNQTLATTTPDPNDTNWDNYTLATAQPGNNPTDVVLFALDTTTGKLWESVNPNAGTPNGGTTIIGTGHWTQIGGTIPPNLLQGDVINVSTSNPAGTIELWAKSGTTLTAYTLSGTTLSQENTQTYNAPLSEWPLTDGNINVEGPATATATDAVASKTATLNGAGATWDDADYFSTDINLDGQTGYLTPPSTTIPTSNATPKISLWFKTTTPGQVLLSLQSTAVSPDNPTTSGAYDPVLYIGTDGKLYAEWWNNTLAPIASSTTVDNGLWHHAILTGYPNGQTLFLDNPSTGTYMPGPIDLSQTNPGNLTIGAGYIGGSWPNEPHYHPGDPTGYLNYFQGQIADVIYSYPGGP